MNVLMWVADLCGVIGMGFFLFAEIRQLWKILKTHKVSGISHHAYTSKLAATAFTSVMLAITALYMSLGVILLEGIVIAWVIHLMNKYKKER